MRLRALRAAVASAAALSAIGLTTVAHAQSVAPTASVPGCHTFDAAGQPATLFAPGDKIIVKGEGFGLVTAIGITFVQQSKTTNLAQSYSSELGVFSTDRVNPAIPTTAAPGAASIHAFSSTRVATCAVQVMAAAAAAPKKKSGSSGFVAVWGALLLIFGIVLAMVGLRRWRAGRLRTAVEQSAPRVVEQPAVAEAAIAPAAVPHDEFDLPTLEPVDAKPPVVEPPLVEPMAAEPAPVSEPDPADEVAHAPLSIADIAAPPLPEDEPVQSSRTLADLAAPPLQTEEPEHSPRSLADLAAPPHPEPEEDLEELPAHEDGPARSWPARPPLERSDEILTPGVYWPPEELEDADEDAYFLASDDVPEDGAPPIAPGEPNDGIPEDLLDRPSHGSSTPVDVADASDVADAMEVPIPGTDLVDPPILDADIGGEWPAWNGRGQVAPVEPADDAHDEDPVVVEGDMSDTVARLVEEMKGWNKA